MQLKNLYEIFLKHPIVCTDTRKLEKGCMFFALKGGNFNGNEFAEKALLEGAAFAVIDEIAFKKNGNTILVEDVLKTLQDLAKQHRKQLNIPVIAIVGSNGKTTTKELIASTLETKFNLLSTPGNFNNHIGLPLTLLSLNQEHEIAIIEMGANHEHENAFLCEIACPTHGLVTNNGKDHLEGFGSLEGVIRSNAELYQYLFEHKGVAFVNANDSVLVQTSQKIANLRFYQSAEKNSINENKICIQAKQFQPNIAFELNGTAITSNLSGDYNFDNILAAVAIGLEFGLTEIEIKKGIESYEPKNLRSQQIETGKNKVFLDAYNANPSSMEASIKNFHLMPGTNKVLILGDMFELGNFEAEEHQHLVNFCAELGLLTVLLVGKAFANTQTNFHQFLSTQEAKDFILNQNYNGKFIFLKGSRGMKLETLLEVL